MGVDHNAYIGPYLRCTETIRPQKIDHCAKHDAGNSAYCPKCGRSKADRIYKFEGGDTPDGWEEEYTKGSFYNYFVITYSYTVKNKRTYLYLPNCYEKELKIPHVEGGKYSEEEISFEEMDVTGITKKFETLFKDEIEYLKRWFTVEVKFGYIAWCS